MTDLSVLRQGVLVIPACLPVARTMPACRYLIMFASLVPWAAPLTLIYTLAKIKQVIKGLQSGWLQPLGM